MKNFTTKRAVIFCGMMGASLSGNVAHGSDPGQIAKSIVEKPIEFHTTSTSIEREESSPQQNHDKKTYVLRHILLKGNKVFSEDELSPLYQSMLGEKVSFQDLQLLANKVTEHYMKAGYVLSSAILPQQDISDGTVTLQVVEGYVDQISIEDPSHAVNSRIQTYLNRILESRPLHKDVLERNLILIQRLAGVQIQIFFKPLHKEGASDLVVKLSRTPVQGAVLINNSGTSSVGPWRGTIQGTFNNLTDNDDSLELSVVTTENTKDVRAGFFSYTLPLDMGGTKLVLGGSATKSKPSGDLAGQDIRSKSNGMQILIDTPFILEKDQLLTANAGVSFSNSISDSPISVSHYRDKFRSLVASLNYELSDSLMGSNLAQISVEYGLPAFGATTTPGTNRSVSRGTANFVNTNMVLSRLQHLEKWIPNTSLFAVFHGQISSATLLSSKKFGVGGSPYYRPYKSYTITGDSGFQARLEARYGEDINHPIVNNYMLYAYYTYGRAWSRYPSSQDSRVNSAPGIGAGVRLLISKSWNWYFEYARPLKDKINGSANKDKFYTGISYYF